MVTYKISGRDAIYANGDNTRIIWITPVFRKIDGQLALKVRCIVQVRGENEKHETQFFDTLIEAQAWGEEQIK